MICNQNWAEEFIKEIGYRVVKKLVFEYGINYQELIVRDLIKKEISNSNITPEEWDSIERQDELLNKEKWLLREIDENVADLNPYSIKIRFIYSKRFFNCNRS